MSFNNKVIVIGKGRFGSATAQGLRRGFIEGEEGRRVKCDVVQVSATSFMALSTSEMADELQDTAFVAYCGTMLSDYAMNLALAIQQAAKQSTGPPLEFIDFSNPDPTLERAGVSGAVDLWVALNTQGKDEEATKNPDIKVWKITEVGSTDVSGIVSNTDGLVYGSHPGQVPKIIIPHLSLSPAPSPNDLFEEARHRIMERAGIDCWHDGNIMGIAMFAFTSMYAIIRYNVNLNGKEPHSNIIMYLLDKGTCWTALWMMVVSPFAGNLLALGSIFQKWSDINLFQKMVTLFCSLIMIIPTVLFLPVWILWVIARIMYFMVRWPVGVMYLGQFAAHEPHNTNAYWIKATLVDMVNLKGETGCVGFVYALVHSFLGCIICDVAYKGYWFDPESGRLMWRFELSMMTGCISTALLWVVAMRSVMGKASWIRLKPLYSYASPIGIWFGVIHVMAFGAKGWNKLFNTKYHNGQMSITFVSSMYPACVLLVHHVMSTFGTKKPCATDHLWKHSVVNVAKVQYDKIISRLSNRNPEFMDGTIRANELSMRDASMSEAKMNFYEDHLW